MGAKNTEDTPKSAMVAKRVREVFPSDIAAASVVQFPDLLSKSHYHEQDISPYNVNKGGTITHAGAPALSRLLSEMTTCVS
jgi:hypothetical protein